MPDEQIAWIIDDAQPKIKVKKQQTIQTVAQVEVPLRDQSQGQGDSNLQQKMNAGQA